MADCVTRVWALAIATAACVGLPSALVYAIVRIAAARRYLATFAMAVVLVFWVTISAAYYPRVCADLVPWPRFLRLPRRGGGSSLLLLIQRPSSSVAQVDGDRGGSGGIGALPRVAPAARVGSENDVISPPSPYPYEHQRVPLAQRHGDRGSRRMAALRREPPAAARGKARPADDVQRPPCERQSDDGGSCKYCAICMADVDKEEAARWLPLCLHVFHRHCIDQWLRGHSTCPICRCNAILDGR